MLHSTRLDQVRCCRGSPSPAPRRRAGAGAGALSRGVSKAAITERMTNRVFSLTDIRPRYWRAAGIRLQN